MRNGYSKSAVVFLDVLGTRDRTTFEQRHAVHQVFHSEARMHEARQKELEHVAYERTVRSFSDCAFFIYRYKSNISKERENDDMLIFTQLGNIANSMLRFISSGFLVRGGLAFGDCHLDDLGLFGPAADCAYHIESKLAKYPRLMLEDEVGQRLFKWEQAQELHPMMADVFTEPPRLLQKDHDGKIFLNVFHHLEQSNSLHLGDTILTLETLRSEIISNLEMRLEDTTDERVLEKLHWMHKFTSSARSKIKCGVSPLGSFVIGGRK